MIQSIDTEYKGYKFRSRLEARWAVFFDACGFKWEYEPEGYDVDGIKYLPDFRLYDVERRTWDKKDAARPFFVEVKGVMDDSSRAKIEAFGKHFPVYVVGNVPFSDNIFGVFDEIGKMFDDDIAFFSYNTIDGDSYPAGLFVSKRGNPMICGPDHDEDFDDIDINKTAFALKKARAARFEHGAEG